MDPVIIVGTGLAGYSTARELRKHNKDIPLVMVTRDDGASYYKPDLSDAYTKDATPDSIIKKRADGMAEELGATVLTGEEVRKINAERREIELGDGVFRYSKLVLAFGADPIVLQFNGDAAESVCRVNNLADYRTFRAKLADVKHVAVLGAGLIGSEFANDLSGAGYDVSVVDPAGWPLAQLIPEDCGQAVAEVLGHAGVRWFFGRSAVSIEHGERELQVVLDNKEIVRADMVLSAVGLRVGTDLAQKAGLTVGRGISVDRTLKTSDPHIYAVGDCAEVDGFWRPYVGPLVQCARTLGQNLAGGDEEGAAQVRYAKLPIIVKTHVCPVVVYPPVATEGEWQIDGAAPHVEARFIGNDDRTLGFALIGDGTKKRGEYLKEVPPLMD